MNTAQLGALKEFFKKLEEQALEDKKAEELRKLQRE